MITEDQTRLTIDWDQANAKWRFQASRNGDTWAWQITPEAFKYMIETMQAMDDELDCAVGARIRSKVNKKDNN